MRAVLDKIPVEDRAQGVASSRLFDLFPGRRAPAFGNRVDALLRLLHAGAGQLARPVNLRDRSEGAELLAHLLPPDAVHALPDAARRQSRPRRRDAQPETRQCRVPVFTPSRGGRFQPVDRDLRQLQTRHLDVPRPRSECPLGNSWVTWRPVYRGLLPPRTLGNHTRETGAFLGDFGPFRWFEVRRIRS